MSPALAGDDIIKGKHGRIDGTPQTDERPGPMRRDSYHHSTTFYSQNRNMRSKSGIHQRTMPYAYREDITKKDQGWCFLDEGSVPSVPDEDGPAIMAVTAPVATEDGGTYKTQSK
jgi:hypothetical protein